MSKYFLYISISICLHLDIPLFCQSIITGRVINKDNNPIEFANVLLLRENDSTFVHGTITNDLGEYQIDNVSLGKYSINISYLGYSTHNTDHFEIKENGNIKINDIVLYESPNELAEIEIKVKKLYLKKKVDRTLIEVQKTSRNAIDVIEKSPGVILNKDNGDISINGRQGAIIMINGKINRLPKDVLIKLLEGINSDNIKKIELITAPSSEFDAEGNAGVINIVMEDNINNGLGKSGNFSALAGYNSGSNLQLNTTLNYKTNRISYFSNINLTNNKIKPKWISKQSIIENDLLRSILSENNRDANILLGNFRLGMVINLNERTSAEIIVNSYLRNWKTDDLIITKDEVLSKKYSIKSIVQEKDKLSSITQGIGINHNFNDLNKLNIQYDYLYFKKDQPSFYDNTIIHNDNQSDIQKNFISVISKTPINFHVIKADVTSIKNNFEITLGTKASFSNFRNSNSTTGITNVLTGNILDEDIYATFFALKRQLKKINIKGGVRYEYTETFLKNNLGSVLNKSKFGYFFPSISVGYEFKERESIFLNYNHRITRPSYNDLATSFFFINPSTILSGNPTLKPSLSRQIEIGVIHHMFTMSLAYNYLKNSIASFQPNLDNQNRLVYSSQNLKYLKQININGTFLIKMTNWWDMHNGLNLNFSEVESIHLEKNIKKNNFEFIYSSTNSFSLPSKFLMEVIGIYNSTSLNGISTLSRFSRLDLAIKKNINNISFSIIANDIFGTTPRSRNSNLSLNNINSSLLYDFRIRSISLVITKNFGSGKLNDVKLNQRAEDERKRVN